MTNLSRTNLNNGVAVGPQGEGRDSPSSFPVYLAYKDTRVPWIGEVPVTWEVKQFKWLLDNNDGGVWGDDPTGEGDTFVLRSTDQTVDGHWKLTDPAPRKLSAKEKASALLIEGDLVVTKSSGSSLHIGKTTLVTADIVKQGCCYGNFMQRLRVNSNFVPKLAWYVMNNELARAQLDLLSNSTTGLANLNGTLIGEILLPVSTVAEQNQIARFLDHETARIDALIEEQQRLIELLKEKRQAVISHAVTKGLDPTVPMKDSGVEWLGEVPEHWTVTKLKFVTDQVVDCPHETPIYDPDGDYLVIRTADIDQGVLKPEQMYRLDREQYTHRTRRMGLEKNDVVYSREGERWGHAALVPQDDLYALGQRMMQLRVCSNVCPEFFMYQLNSVATYRQGEVDTVGATAPHVNISTVINYYLMLPAIAEQREISQYLSKTLDGLDCLLGESLEMKGLLQERRSALISAAVTGKIDVRGWQPPASTQAPKLEVAEAV